MVLQSALDNKLCQEVGVNDEYKGDSEVKRMLAILETRTNDRLQQVVSCELCSTFNVCCISRKMRVQMMNSQCLMSFSAPLFCHTLQAVLHNYLTKLVFLNTEFHYYYCNSCLSVYVCPMLEYRLFGAISILFELYHKVMNTVRLGKILCIQKYKKHGLAAEFFAS